MSYQSIYISSSLEIIYFYRRTRSTIKIDQLKWTELLSQQRNILQVATPVAVGGAIEIKGGAKYTVGGVMLWCEKIAGGVSVVIGGANDTDSLFRVGGVSCVMALLIRDHNEEIRSDTLPVLSDKLTGLFPHRLIICVPVEHHWTLSCDGMDYFDFDGVSCDDFFSSYFW